MRYRARMLGLIGTGGLFLGTSLLACGDKFLVAGRGARFQRGAAHATILIYAPPASSLSGGIGSFSVDGALSRAGYRPATAASAEELGEILKEKRPEVVVVGLEDARAVEKHASPGSAGPIILPVLRNASRREMAEARKAWGVALKSPASSDSLLDAVDEAVQMYATRGKLAELKH